MSPLQLEGKGEVVITGATGSMGVVATRELAREGKTVIMACRNLKKAEAAKAQILKEVPDAHLRIMQLDLSSFASIRQFARKLEEMNVQIDALFNNAGTMARRYEKTVDGFESDFATNYLGNRLLCLLLLPMMKKGGHIVNMVSLTTKFAHLDLDWQNWGEKRFSQLGTYGSSKLALLYFSIALAWRHPELHINVSDPGIVDSNMITMGRWYDPLADIFFRPFIKTPQQGVQPALRALKTNETMKYFVGKKTNDIPSRFLQNPLVEQLWSQAEDLQKLSDNI